MFDNYYVQICIAVCYLLVRGIVRGFKRLLGQPQQGSLMVLCYHEVSAAQAAQFAQ